jgi:stage II sporulation protein D
MRRGWLCLATVLAIAGASLILWPTGDVLAQGAPASDTIRIGVAKNGSYDVTTLPLETYVARVLTGEALPGSEPAALEALAISIRTYALGNRNRHRAEGFDLCDQTHCQVMRASTLINERAALATAGQVLLYRGVPATVYYSASCGGHTEKPSNVWPGSDDPPYLPSQEEDGCGGFPQWSTELSLRDLQRALQSAGFRGTLRGLKVNSKNESGRASQIAIEGMTPPTIAGQDFRAAVGRTLGWQYMQSTTFELTRSGDAFRFRGHGNGHGVGMCVIGSTKLAIRGQSARQILGRYFPGTEIGSVGPRVTPVAPDRPTLTAVPRPPVVTAPPARAAAVPPTSASSSTDINVLLPEGDEGERNVVTGLVARHRDDLAKTLNVTPLPELTLRFHPTTDAYEQHTGLPWYTLGMKADAELQFVPLVVLRDRGVFDRVLRRQLVHALVDPALPGRPVWIREGAGVHFAEGSNGPEAREACPRDSELLAPASASALGDALARARACFERQLSAGRAWRDVR